jgi:hypothetical protein
MQKKPGCQKNNYCLGRKQHGSHRPEEKKRSSMAAALAVRRHHVKSLGGSLGGEFDGHHMNNSFGRLSFEFSNRTKSEQDVTPEKEGQNFPRAVDIVKDFEIGVLVGRKLFPFYLFVFLILVFLKTI